jgi:type II restriction/modification system DNA methylase subunit YeeA
MGDTKGGAFDLPLDEALLVLLDPNPSGRPNSDVVIPWCNGLDLTRRNREMFIVDFGTSKGAEGAASFASPWRRVEALVKPERAKNKRDTYREHFWLHVEGRSGFRRAVVPRRRFLATARVAKHRLFSWFELPTLPDSQLIVFALDGDDAMGVLHSRIHEVWALAQGTQLREKESGFRYTPTTCFETFPFPSMEASDKERTGAAAKELDELRRAWLNPAEWTKTEVLEFPGSVDGPWKRFVVDPDARGIGTVRWPRAVPRDADCAKKLAERTLTKLYNQRPAWLDNAHRKLDEAVFAAYGWPADLTDEQILERLLAMNLERAT